MALTLRSGEDTALLRAGEGLREPILVTGSGLGSLSFSGAASGVPIKVGTAAGAVSFAGAAEGVRVVAGAATASFTFTGTATGSPEEGTPEEIPDPTPAPTIPRTGWSGLLNVIREAVADLEAQLEPDPVLCPNDGQALNVGSDGTLWCPWDGWQWGGERVWP